MAADFSILTTGFLRGRQALGVSPRTLDAYRNAFAVFVGWLASKELADQVPEVTRAHCEQFFIDQAAREGRKAGITLKPLTLLNYYRSLKTFFRWCVEEGQIEVSPLARVPAPQVPEEPPPVLSEDDLRQLLAACQGAGPYACRDRAILLLLMDTGMRLGEIAGIRLPDLALGERTVKILGKGRRWRTCAFGEVVASALDDYLDVRRRHPDAGSDLLWLGRAGALTRDGLRFVVERRAARAGVAGVHAHRFRHTFAHMWLLAGGQQIDLQSLCGWKSPAMLQRYGASAAGVRARKAHKQFSPVDHL